MKKDFINEQEIQGYLYQLGQREPLTERVTGENSKNPGTKYITGVIEIATDEEGLNIVPIRYGYVTEKTKSGKENFTYKALKEILDTCNSATPKTWVSAGKDGALKLRATKVSLVTNDWYNTQEDTIVSTQRNEGGFLSIITSFKNKPFSKFSMDILINKILCQTDSENPKAIIKGAVFNVGAGGAKILSPVELTVLNAQGIQYLASLEVNSKNPLLTNVVGHIVNSTISTTEVTEGAWGPIVVDKSKTERYWLVDNMSAEPYAYGTEEVLTGEELMSMIQAREVKLAEEKQRTLERQKQKESSNGAFGYTPPSMPVIKADGQEYKF